MNRLRWILIIVLALVCVTFSHAQDPTSTDFYQHIKRYNLSKLWCADSITTQDDGKKLSFPEPLGYIGDSFQRFYIHYISIEKSKSNPYVYNVMGKTKVKNTVCRFKGTITILKAKLYNATDDERYKQGSTECQVVLYEDSLQNSSGYIQGKLKTQFCIDKKNQIHYDAIVLIADNYSNNQCVATWTSYKTKKSKKCNWGDFRIPDSKELDSGVGDVVINPKFLKSGWQTFADCNSTDPAKARKALLVEKARWWK